MSEVYKQYFKARWGDMDFNGHMSNTAYLNVAGDVRMMYFEENGFSMSDFQKLHIGPVVMKDEIEYFKELRLLEKIGVHQLLAGSSNDGSRFRLSNIFYRSDGKKAATITTTGGWLDLYQRKLVTPPPQLVEAIMGLARTKEFEILPNSSK